MMPASGLGPSRNILSTVACSSAISTSSYDLDLWTDAVCRPERVSRLPTAKVPTAFVVRRPGCPLCSSTWQIAGRGGDADEAVSLGTAQALHRAVAARRRARTLLRGLLHRCGPVGTYGEVSH